MKTLFIDTHLFDINISLYADDKLVKQELVTDKKQNSIYLMPSIEKILAEECYDQILVVSGPGSFTSVRLGITVAKTLAYTQNIPIKVLSYFDLMNLSSDDKAHIFGISDGNGYFLAKYANNKLIDEYFYLNNPDYLKYQQDKIVETDVSINMEKVLRALDSIEATNPHAVKPLYVKLIGVEYDQKNN